MSVEKEVHELRTSQSFSSIAGEIMSPTIRPVPAMEPSQCFFGCLRGRWYNLGDGLAKFGDADWPAGLADALEEREAGRLEFRDSNFFHEIRFLP